MIGHPAPCESSNLGLILVINEIYKLSHSVDYANIWFIDAENMSSIPEMLLGSSGTINKTLH